MLLWIGEKDVEDLRSIIASTSEKGPLEYRNHLQNFFLITRTEYNTYISTIEWRIFGRWNDGGDTKL